MDGWDSEEETNATQNKDSNAGNDGDGGGDGANWYAFEDGEYK